MVLNKCKNCFKNKELVCCEECMNKLIFERIFESMQGDLKERIKWMLLEEFDKIEEKVNLLLKDKYLVCIKRGKKLKII